MRKSEVFDRCVSLIAKRLTERTLNIKHPYICKAQHYFAQGTQPVSGIIVSTVDGQAGPITRAWGIVYVNTEYPVRCTEICTSYYGESVALEKLYRELSLQGGMQC